MGKYIEWGNKIFNGCTIVKPIDLTKKGNNDKWEMICFCGNTFISRPCSLQQNLTKSCGCIHKKSARLNGKKHQQQSYLNFTTINKIKIIKPVITEQDGRKNIWIAICPICNIKFKTSLDCLLRYKSCGCLEKKSILNFNKNRRIKMGYDENIMISKENNLIRTMFFSPIQQFILKIDSYVCNLCLKNKNKISVHHIEPIKNNFDYKNIECYQNIYKIDNLITLCNTCHLYLAHDGHSNKLNLEIQKELLAITSMRFISLQNQKIYDKIKMELDLKLKEYLNSLNQ